MFWFSFKNCIKSQIIVKDLFISTLIVTVLFSSLEDSFLGYLFYTPEMCQQNRTLLDRSCGRT